MVMFVVVKAYQKIKPVPPKASPKKGPTLEEILLEIRDLLENKS
jgi:large-conductance mechanosensitive channel